MFRLLISLVLVLAFSAPCLAQESLLYKIALGSDLTLQATDTAISTYIFGQGGTELNPWLAPFQNKPGAFGATKMGVGVASHYLKSYIYNQGQKHNSRRWKNTAWAVVIGEIVLYSWVVNHNLGEVAK
jgi:hypothetical protein